MNRSLFLKLRMEAGCVNHGEGPLRCILVPCQSPLRKPTCKWHKPFHFLKQACLIRAPPLNFGEPLFNLKALTCMPGSKGGACIRVWQIAFAFIGFMIIIKIRGYHLVTTFEYVSKQHFCFYIIIILIFNLKIRSKISFYFSKCTCKYLKVLLLS